MDERFFEPFFFKRKLKIFSKNFKILLDICAQFGYNMTYAEQRVITRM